MPLSTLDQLCALIVVDLQNGVMGAPFADPIERVVDRTRLLLEAFRTAGKPVVLVNADAVPPGRTDAPKASLDLPDGWADLIPELGACGDDIRVTKQSWGAFHGTGLADWLTAIGVKQVVIAGVATGMGVESTAREGHAHGFDVVLATDAMTDTDQRRHDRSVDAIFPYLGEAATAAGVAALLTPAAR